MFKPNKKIAAVLALGMISSLFVGTGAASAANGVAVSVDRVKTFADDAGEQELGQIQIKEDSDYTDAFEEDDSFIITLPSNLKWLHDGNTYITNEKDANGKLKKTPVSVDHVDIKISGDYTMTVTLEDVDVPGADKPDVYKIPLYANFDGVAEGYAYATIDGMDSPVPSGDYAIAQVMGGGTTATCTDTFTAGQDTTDNKFTFRLTETTVGTFKDAYDDHEELKLTLPKDIDFAKVTINGLAGCTGTAGPATSDEDWVTFDGHKLIVDMYELGDEITYTTSGDNARGILEFIVEVDVDDDATLGQADLEVEGEDNIDNATIKVGTVSEFEVALSVDDPTTVLAGKVCQELGTIVMYESVKDTIAGNRSITVTLPDGVQFAEEYSINDIDFTKGASAVSNEKVTKADENAVTFKFDSTGKSRIKIEFPIKYANIAADFTGDIVATISGRAGIEGEVVLGTVNVPAEIKMETVSDVKIGYQNQALADIVITETEAGALLEKGTVVVELPEGVDFADDEATVEVTDGNLEIKNVKIKSATDKYQAAITFEIKSESSANKPGTITISGLYLNVNRTVAEGPIKATLTGTALVQSYEGYKGEQVVIKEYDADGLENPWEINEDWLFDEDEACRLVIANCITPGANEVVNSAVIGTSTFVIGSTAAVIAGEETAMPIAPYISNSRTLCPVRYVAYACGIPEANVVWNPDLQTVTLMNNNGTIVQLTIGSTTMLINGVPVIMDVAPEITGGYTFLPARYVANAFGYDAVWEAATQTVTITPIAK